MKIVFYILLLTNLVFSQGKYEIKFATLAPDGSYWMQKMEEFNHEISRLTNDGISFRMYTGGIAGSEKDVVRKMRFGQIHCASFTGIGLGEIVPDVRVLEIPFFFSTTDEVDYAYNEMFQYFTSSFEEKGFVLLGWAEVGFVYVFSVEPVNSPDDFSRVKMWLWEDDRLARETFKNLGIVPVPLEISDVYTALQTGMLSGFYNSPMGAIALQWFTTVNYMLNYPMANSIGGVVISLKKYQSLPEEYREILKTTTRKYMQEIVKKSREDNLKSIKLLQQNGMKIVNIESDTTIEKLKEAGIKTRNELAGKLFSKESLELLLRTMENYHSGGQ